MTSAAAPEGTGERRGQERERREGSLVFFIYCRHEGRSRWQDLVDKDEYGLLRCQLDAFTDNVHKLADRQILKSKSSRWRERGCVCGV